MDVVTEREQRVRYLVFDVETVADGDLISSVRYTNEQLSAADAIAGYRAELLEQFGRDVLPATFVLPVAVAVAKLDEQFRMLDLTTLDAPEFRPREIVSRFWQGWNHYGRPTLVTFNGRGYDLPVLELAAYRFGLTLPAWFNVESRSYEQSRNRYNIDCHVDLQDLFSNFGSVRISGGLNLMAQMIGKPGKCGIDGSQVQDLYDAGAQDRINDYCCCDVLDTYFVFLRSRVLIGRLTSNQEQTLVNEAREWLQERSAETPAFATYLENWGVDSVEVPEAAGRPR